MAELSSGWLERVVGLATADLAEIPETSRPAWFRARRDPPFDPTNGEDLRRAIGQAAAVYDAVRDLLWRATQYGTTEDGDTACYLLTKGTVHRLVGAMFSAGESAPLRESAVER